MNLTAGQIAQYAAAAGFSGADLVTAVAIALAESGGNPQAYNPETAAGAPQGQGSFGLWQIYLAAHPEFTGEDLTDPQTNANAAYSIYAIAGNNFHPWSTYTSGEYGMYETPAMLAQVMPGTPPGPASSGQLPLVLDAATGQPIVSATPTVANLFTTPPSTSPSIGQVLLWGALGVAALWLFSEA